MKNTMKNKLLLMVMLFVIALPLVIATEDNTAVLFKGEIIEGTTKSFDYAASDDDYLKPVAISVKETQKSEKRCRILFQKEDIWLEEGKEVITQSSFRVRINSVEENLCEVEVRTVDDTSKDIHAYITSVKVDNYKPDQQGYIFVENGAKVVFIATIESDTAVNDVPYVFYNNGNPTGKGATDKLTGTVDLKKGLNYIDWAMVFNYKDDTLYKTGSFLTVLLLDPEEEKINDFSWHGITIYAQSPGYSDDKDKPYAYVNSLTTDNLKPNAQGYIYAKEGEKVYFTIEIESKGDAKNVPYVFYNNGYPTGKGSTQKVTGTVDLKKGLNYVKEAMVFNYKEDTLYNTGSFLTVFLLDPSEEKVAGSYYNGLTIYVKKSNDPSDEPTNPSDPSGKCQEIYRICLENGGSAEKCQEQLPRICREKSPTNLVTEPSSDASDDYTKPVMDCGLVYDGCIKRGLNEYVCQEMRSECERGGYTEPYGKTCDQGCYANSDINKCLPYGTRIEQKGVALYCDIDGSLLEQKNDGDAANNDYECKSNSARYGTCENVAEQNNILTTIFGWLSRLFGGN